MINGPFGLAPADGRIVFVDTETIGLSYEHRDPWEIALIIRDPGKPDEEIEWQLRPNLTHAEPLGLRTGRYYRRNYAQAMPPGAGLIIVSPGWSELDPDKVSDEELRRRRMDADVIANCVAPLLDGATLIGQGPWFDDLGLHNFLRDNGQALTASHRLMCVNSASVAYLHGRADGLAAAGDVEAARQLREQIPPAPWDPEKLSLLVGVTPPPPEERHRALVDARWVRDRFDAMQQAN